MQKATQKEHTLLQILQEKFQSIENLRTLAIDYDRELLSFLLESSEFKERFFTRVDSVVVFEKDKFLDFLKLRILSKSYTAFSNKIGLQLESSLEKSQKVVLNFPFKDCVLKGAQSKDEQKSKEIFFNEVLARSEIDVLFSPKALQNFELIEHSVLSESCESSEKSLRSFISNKLPCDFSHKPQASSQSLECQIDSNNLESQAKSTNQVSNDIDSSNTKSQAYSNNTESKKGAWFIYLKIQKGSKENLGRPKVTPQEVAQRLSEYMRGNSDEF